VGTLSRTRRIKGGPAGTTRHQAPTPHDLTITQSSDAPTVPTDHAISSAEPVDPSHTDPGVTAEAPVEDPVAEAPPIEGAGDGDGVEGEPEAADTDPPEPPVRPDRSRTPRRPAASGGGARPAKSGSNSGAGPADRRTAAQRLGNFPRADKPAPIPAPEHHHLPGWVRRDFARARPPLGNILALLEGDVHDTFEQRIKELTEGISAGRFSLAWQYPDLVDEGRALYEKQRRESAETARASRQLDTGRRRVQDRIRDAADQLGADVAARLQRQLRSASDQDAINAVASELDGVATAARSTADKRREREIERTRARIQRSAAAAGAAAPTPQTETWQDVLRRFAEQQAAGSGAE
jgi:hypothetical protein